MNSYLAQRLSAAKRNVLNLLLVSVPMIPINLFLWMRVLSIAEQRIVDELGPYVEGKPLARHFSVEGGGESFIYTLIIAIQLR